MSEHVLDEVLRRTEEAVAAWTPDKWVESWMLGHLACEAGGAAMDAWDTADHDAPVDGLVACAASALVWARALVGEPVDVSAMVRAEYDRASAKHGGMTPFHQGMDDLDRAAILIEEVGEVARALTPDASTPVGHGGDLGEELVQVATMALAWAARCLDDLEGCSRCAPAGGERQRREADALAYVLADVADQREGRS